MGTPSSVNGGLQDTATLSKLIPSTLTSMGASNKPSNACIITTSHTELMAKFYTLNIDCCWVSDIRDIAFREAEIASDLCSIVS